MTILVKFGHSCVYVLYRGLCLCLHTLLVTWLMNMCVVYVLFLCVLVFRVA